MPDFQSLISALWGLFDHLFSLILFAELENDFEYALADVKITKHTNQVFELLLM